MKIFEILKRHYSTLGISRSNQSNQNGAFNKKLLFGFLLFGCLILSQFVYIFHVASGFMEYTNVICSASASILMFICFAVNVFQTAALFKSIDNIEKFIDTRCANPESRRFFMKTSHQIERLSEITFMVLMKIVLQCYMLPKSIFSFGVYFVTDSERSLFQLPFPMWFPFHLNNPIGYLIAVVLQYVILGYEFSIVACILALGIGAWCFVISSIKEIQHILYLINHKSLAKESNEVFILLAEFIDAHGALKQLVHDLSDLFQPMFIFCFTWSIFAISGAMLMVQVEILQHGHLMPLFQLNLCGIFAFALVFILCELCQRLGDAFDGINYTIEQWDWYSFPIEIKRTLPMIIVHAQISVSVQWFGSYACTRQVFKNVIHRAYSYFMVLRQFSD